MRAHNPKILSEIVLYVLFNEALETGAKLNVEDIAERLSPAQVTSTLILFAIDDLMSRNFAVNSTVGPYVITRSGYDYVRYRLSLRGAAIHEFSKSRDWLVEAEQLHDDAPDEDGVSQSVPASDRFVPIDHNSPETGEGIEALEAVVQQGRENNQFRELFADPEDASVVLSEMEAGIGLLKNSKANVETIRRLLVSRLEWIQAKLPDWTGAAALSVGLGWLVKLMVGG